MRRDLEALMSKRWIYVMWQHVIVELLNSAQQHEDRRGAGGLAPCILTSAVCGGEWSTCGRDRSVSGIQWGGGGVSHTLSNGKSWCGGQVMRKDSEYLSSLVSPESHLLRPCTRAVFRRRAGKERESQCTCKADSTPALKTRQLRRPTKRVATPTEIFNEEIYKNALSNLDERFWRLQFGVSPASSDSNAVRGVVNASARNVVQSTLRRYIFWNLADY